MTFSIPGNLAFVTALERGAIISVAVVLGWDRLAKQNAGIPLWRFDVALITHWYWPHSERESCGCKAFYVGPIAVYVGHH